MDSHNLAGEPGESRDQEHPAATPFPAKPLTQPSALTDACRPSFPEMLARQKAMDRQIAIDAAKAKPPQSAPPVIPPPIPREFWEEPMRVKPFPAGAFPSNPNEGASGGYPAFIPVDRADALLISGYSIYTYLSFQFAPLRRYEIKGVQCFRTEELAALANTLAKMKPEEAARHLRPIPPAIEPKKTQWWRQNAIPLADAESKSRRPLPADMKVWERDGIQYVAVDALRKFLKRYR